MRNNKIRFILALAGLSVLWVSCQKNASDPTTKNQKAQYIKSFGAVEDDPSQMRKVPLIMSTDFAKTGSSLDGNLLSGKGKPAKPPTSTKDVTAPTVAITSPVNGSTVSGTVSIQVTASDNVGVASVSLAVNGSVVGTLTTAPYNFSWNSGSVGDGNHTLTATAKDAAGNSSSNSIVVAKNTVIVVTPPPANLPASFSLTMPPVMNQGSEGSCIAVAVAYARSYEAYNRTNATSYSQSTNVLSPEYLFNQTKSGTSCSGSALLTTFNFLQTNGICTWASMPYSYTNGCSLMPTSQQTAQAANFRIASYSQISNSDITAIKSMLAQNRPLVSQYSVDDQFYGAGPGFIWKTFSGSIGYHALVICGYDDSKNAFKVINQWGTSWGDAGYSWIDYNLLKTVSSNLLVMNF